MSTRSDTPAAELSGIAAELLSLEPTGHQGRTILIGLIVAAFLHGAAAWAVSRAEPPPPKKRSAPLVMVEHVVELPPPKEEPPPPEPEPEPEPPPPPKKVRRASRRARLVKPRTTAPRATKNAGPPPPAQAGKVIAQEPADAPLDFTGFSITSGKGPKYAGGVTASKGTNTKAVHTKTVDPNARPDQPQGEARLDHPVGLSARNWRCPWPREADPLGIDEQVVLLRAVVDARGRASSVRLLADPGHGFGRAALACAKRARFNPATDRNGRPYAATSPPIRVRFTR